MWNVISSRTKGGDFGKNVTEFQLLNVRDSQGHVKKSRNDARLVGSNFRDPIFWSQQKPRNNKWNFGDQRIANSFKNPMEF